MMTIRPIYIDFSEFGQRIAIELGDLLSAQVNCTSGTNVVGDTNLLQEEQKVSITGYAVTPGCDHRPTERR
jgi:hypothetical protein